MMAKIALVDDDVSVLQTLSVYINKYCGDHNKEKEIKTFTCISEFMLCGVNNFDVVFMDVELPDGNGIDAIKKLRKTNNDAIIVFVTNMAQFAVRGYEVRAMDYVVKPVSYFNFASKLDSVFSALEISRTAYVWITNKDGRIRLNATQIKYVEVFQHTLIYHTESGDYKESGSIALAQKKLEKLPFAPCSRFYLVNLSYVTRVNGFFATIGEYQLAISKRMRGQFLKELNCFISRGGVLKTNESEEGGKC